MRHRSGAAVLAVHLLSLLFFTAVAIALSWPLARTLDLAIPGEPGDNYTFLWNTWWMRQAVADPAVEFFHTDRLFVPFGIDLTLHTHTALPSWIAATLLGRWPLVAAHNLVILGSLALNGFCAYLLAWDRLRAWTAAILAGLVFASSAYMAAHLLGHDNLIAAWGLPLFLVFLLRAVERRSRLAAAGAGLAVVVTAYCDYYYVVYEAAVALAAVMTGLPRREVVIAPRPWRRVVVPLALLLVVDVLLAAGVMVSGGTSFTLAGQRVSATRPTNLLAFAWLLALALLLASGRPRVLLTLPTVTGMRQRLAAIWPAVAVATAGLMPLLINGWKVWRRGDYTAPPFSWRSGPAGVDLASLVLGHPLNHWTGAWTRSAYEALHIDRVEGSAWIGLTALVAVAWAVATTSARPHEERRETRRWLLIAAVAFAWALGPWLHVAGVNAGLLLPQKFAAMLPVVSNARIPGRAMVLVTLAAGMVLGSLVGGLRRDRRWMAGLACVVAIALESWTAPYPLTPTAVPTLYTVLRDLPPGAVFELPGGVRDGFGTRGRPDERAMLYQTVHGHPIVGGFAARVPASIIDGYAAFPVLRSLIALSGGGAADPRDEALSAAAAGAAIEQASVRYLVLDRATAGPALVNYLERHLPLTRLAADGGRELYALTAAATTR